MNLKTYNNDGILVPIESDDLGFTPKRIFYVYGVSCGEERGNHAHHETQQLLVCVRGSILVKIHDGFYESSTLLKENDSIFVDRMMWDSQIYLTGDDILLSICSTTYNKNDYIEDFEEFVSLVKGEDQ
jgi:dTDP-4-dehydrorhamnose 3,5-epimerase-like enzyme